MESVGRGSILTNRLTRSVGRGLLSLLLGLTACGSPSPEAPGPSSTTEAVGASLSSPTSTAASLSAQPAAKPDGLSTDASRRTSPLLNGRAPLTVSPADPPASDEKMMAEQALRAARTQWYAEVRESPDVTVRLQALEVWAQQRGDAFDPVTFALVDEDESVRTRAQELYEQQLMQGTGSAVCGGACPAVP